MKRILVLFCLISFSCGGKIGNGNSRVFKEIHEYVLNLDRYTSPVEEYIQYVPNWKGKEVFAIHVRGMFEIKLYDFTTNELLETLKYSHEGPKAYPNTYDFHIHDENNIFMNRRYHYRAHLVNQHFDLIKTFEFLDPGTKVDPVSGIPLSGKTFLPMFNHNKIFKKFPDKFILTASPDISSYDPKKFYADCLLINVELETGEISRVKGYPEKMHGKAWGVLHSYIYTDYSERKEQYFLSYAADEELYVENDKFERIASFSAKPEKFKEIKAIPVNAVFNDPVYMTHYNEQFVFGSVLYDEHRDLIYRIALEPNPNYGDTYTKDPLHEPRNMIVMAFDSNYEKIAEMRLEQSEDGVYLDRCFVNEKGLNITYVDLNNEDKLYFKTFLVE
ncbi:hypothetical protein Belba_1799 [Belliella baltica DSM 15883]|uniref:DUF4221 domain-containing protein n=1 Tax=Belliella baltica (strain DSM 15883 / CIP 108006 / LMG 21964 / BA134) TaxID=866536 RepID=I3Z578_BELBD|nr:DUF4221 family protein [Belliella baltica]AFL84396.1 hypothetical protein Belba_1799 [Belliella baltica DSM 15883]